MVQFLGITTMAQFQSGSHAQCKLQWLTQTIMCFVYCVILFTVSHVETMIGTLGGLLSSMSRKYLSICNQWEDITIHNHAFQSTLGIHGCNVCCSVHVFLYLFPSILSPSLPPFLAMHFQQFTLALTLLTHRPLSPPPPPPTPPPPLPDTHLSQLNYCGVSFPGD